ncbi:RHS repeat-associated core domain-containing protein [Sulfidibacter corallicola]|uniref:RHS repeat-associated core domain-containing protein n=1 Tax=Sulfidibacter corallicola TaxID=2818388 RepID=A0A8A4TFS9_SULCO|nr:RHS repeat-associated core domain-containing protein [Sulfidibacter corallicola]QTD48410.1 RHS repeat-associated core domain-containing protein [Sulfidibacter corallicola]
MKHSILILATLATYFSGPLLRAAGTDYADVAVDSLQTDSASVGAGVEIPYFDINYYTGMVTAQLDGIQAGELTLTPTYKAPNRMKRFQAEGHWADALSHQGNLGKDWHLGHGFLLVMPHYYHGPTSYGFEAIAEIDGGRVTPFSKDRYFVDHYGNEGWTDGLAVKDRYFVDESLRRIVREMCPTGPCDSADEGCRYGNYVMLNPDGSKITYAKLADARMDEWYSDLASRYSVFNPVRPEMWLPIEVVDARGRKIHLEYQGGPANTRQFCSDQNDGHQTYELADWRVHRIYDHERVHHFELGWRDFGGQGHPLDLLVSEVRYKGGGVDRVMATFSYAARDLDEVSMTNGGLSQKRFYILEEVNRPWNIAQDPYGSSAFKTTLGYQTYEVTNLTECGTGQPATFPQPQTRFGVHLLTTIVPETGQFRDGRTDAGVRLQFADGEQQGIPWSCFKRATYDCRGEHCWEPLVRMNNQLRVSTIDYADVHMVVTYTPFLDQGPHDGKMYRVFTEDEPIDARSDFLKVTIGSYNQVGQALLATNELYFAMPGDEAPTLENQSRLIGKLLSQRNVHYRRVLAGSANQREASEYWQEWAYRELDPTKNTQYYTIGGHRETGRATIGPFLYGYASRGEDGFSHVVYQEYPSDVFGGDGYVKPVASLYQPTLQSRVIYDPQMNPVKKVVHVERTFEGRFEIVPRDTSQDPYLADPKAQRFLLGLVSEEASRWSFDKNSLARFDQTRIRHGYDAQGFPVWKRLFSDASQNQSINFVYDYETDATGFTYLAAEALVDYNPQTASSLTVPPHRATIYSDYRFGRPGKINRPDGKVDTERTSDSPLETETQFDALGRPVRVVQNGTAVTYTYDDVGRPLWESPDAVEPLRHIYPSPTDILNGNIFSKQVQEGAGSATTQVLDRFGREQYRDTLVSHGHDLWKRADEKLYEGAELVKSRNAYGGEVLVSKDVFGREREILLLDDQGAVHKYAETTYDMTPEGHTVVTERVSKQPGDLDFETTYSETDPLGRLVRTGRNMGAVQDFVCYSHTQTGTGIETQTRPYCDEGQVRTVARDLLGRIQWERHPEIEGDIVYHYDGYGRLASRTTPEHTTRFLYDNADRNIGLEQIEPQVTPLREYHYDPTNDLLASATTAEGVTYQFGYDTANRPSTLDVLIPRQPEGPVGLRPNGSVTKGSQTHFIWASMGAGWTYDLELLENGALLWSQFGLTENRAEIPWPMLIEEQAYSWRVRGYRDNGGTPTWTSWRTESLDIGPGDGDSPDFRVYATRNDSSFPQYRLGDIVRLEIRTVPPQPNQPVFVRRKRDGFLELADAPLPHGQNRTDENGILVTRFTYDDPSFCGHYTEETFAVGTVDGPRSTALPGYTLACIDEEKTRGTLLLATDSIDFGGTGEPHGTVSQTRRINNGTETSSIPISDLQITVHDVVNGQVQAGTSQYFSFGGVIDNGTGTFANTLPYSYGAWGHTMRVQFHPNGTTGRREGLLRIHYAQDLRGPQTFEIPLAGEAADIGKMFLTRPDDDTLLAHHLDLGTLMRGDVIELWVRNPLADNSIRGSIMVSGPWTLLGPSHVIEHRESIDFNGESRPGWFQGLLVAPSNYLKVYLRYEGEPGEATFTNNVRLDSIVVVNGYDGPGDPDDIPVGRSYFSVSVRVLDSSVAAPTEFVDTQGNPLSELRFQSHMLGQHTYNTVDPNIFLASRHADWVQYQVTFSSEFDDFFDTASSFEWKVTGGAGLAKSHAFPLQGWITWAHMGVTRGSVTLEPIARSYYGSYDPASGQTRDAFFNTPTLTMPVSFVVTDRLAYDDAVLDFGSAENGDDRLTTTLRDLHGENQALNGTLTLGEGPFSWDAAYYAGLAYGDHIQIDGRSMTLASFPMNGFPIRIACDWQAAYQGRVDVEVESTFCATSNNGMCPYDEGEDVRLYLSAHFPEPDAAGGTRGDSVPDYNPATTLHGRFAMEYDAFGNLKRLTMPSGRAQSWTFDQIGNHMAAFLESGSQSIPIAEAVIEMAALGQNGYGRDGGVRHFRYKGAFGTRFADVFYRNDTFGRPVGRDLRATGTWSQRETLWAHHVTDAMAYDLRGHLTGYQTQTDGNGPVASTFTYDTFGQLTRFQLGQESIDYGYDAFGNMLQRTSSLSGIDSFDYGGGSSPAYVDNRLEGHRYSPNGNLLDDGTYRYRYDALDRLVLVTDQDGSPVQQAVYDPFGNRVRVTTTNRTTYSFRVQEQTAEAFVTGEGSENHWKAYVQFNGERVFESATDETAGHRLLFSDYLGSVVYTIDQSKQHQAYGYTPFGEAMPSGGIRSGEGGFTGHANDPAAGLVYMMKRSYAPFHFAFTRPDPARDFGLTPISHNLYQYARNNPVNRIDPDGLTSQKKDKKKQARRITNVKALEWLALETQEIHIFSPSLAGMVSKIHNNYGQAYNEALTGVNNMVGMAIAAGKGATSIPQHSFLYFVISSFVWNEVWGEAEKQTLDWYFDMLKNTSVDFLPGDHLIKVEFRGGKVAAMWDEHNAIIVPVDATSIELYYRPSRNAIFTIREDGHLVELYTFEESIETLDDDAFAEALVNGMWKGITNEKNWIIEKKGHATGTFKAKWRWGKNLPTQ